MTIVIDASTGLPELPEGMFWRVRRDEHEWEYIGYTRYDGWDYIKIELHKEVVNNRPIEVKKKTWYRKAVYKNEEYKGSEVVNSKSWKTNEFLLNSTDSQNKILQNAGRQVFADWRAAENRRDHMGNLLGDYPPKKLEFADEQKEG